MKNGWKTRFDRQRGKLDSLQTQHAFVSCVVCLFCCNNRARNVWLFAGISGATIYIYIYFFFIAQTRTFLWCLDQQRKLLHVVLCACQRGPHTIVDQIEKAQHQTRPLISVDVTLPFLAVGMVFCLQQQQQQQQQEQQQRQRARSKVSPTEWQVPIPLTHIYQNMHEDTGSTPRLKCQVPKVNTHAWAALIRPP